MRQKPDEWFRDLDARQRNTVFPDTAANEARFWRNLMEGRQRLTGIQMAGILVMGLLAVALVGITAIIISDPDPVFSWVSLLRNVVYWTIAFAIIFGFLALAKLSLKNKHNSKLPLRAAGRGDKFHTKE